MSNTARLIRGSATGIVMTILDPILETLIIHASNALDQLGPTIAKAASAYESADEESARSSGDHEGSIRL